MSAIWMLTWRGWTTTILWLILLVCCVSALIAVVLGVLLRHSFLWWLASTLALLGVVLSISLAALDKLGFK